MREDRLRPRSSNVGGGNWGGGVDGRGGGMGDDAREDVFAVVAGGGLGSGAGFGGWSRR